MGTFWEACQPPKVWKEGFGAEGRKRRREREREAARQAQLEQSDANDANEAGAVLGLTAGGSDDSEEGGAEDRGGRSTKTNLALRASWVCIGHRRVACVIGASRAGGRRLVAGRRPFRAHP